MSAARLRQIADLFDVSTAGLSGAAAGGLPDGADGLPATFLGTEGSLGLMKAWLALDPDRQRLAVRLLAQLATNEAVAVAANGPA